MKPLICSPGINAKSAAGICARPFGRCPKRLIWCPAAMQHTGYFGVGKKTRATGQSKHYKLKTTSVFGTSVFFEYPVKLISISWMATSWQTKQTNVRQTVISAHIPGFLCIVNNSSVTGGETVNLNKVIPYFMSFFAYCFWASNSL